MRRGSVLRRGEIPARPLVAATEWGRTIAASSAVLRLGCAGCPHSRSRMKFSTEFCSLNAFFDYPFGSYKPIQSSSWVDTS